MWKLIIAAVAFAAWASFSAPAFAVDCGNFCIGKCQSRSGPRLLHERMRTTLLGGEKEEALNFNAAFAW